VVLVPVALMARVPLRRFIAAVAEPVSIAFATTSSEAALPRAMEAMEKLGVPRQIVASDAHRPASTRRQQRTRRWPPFSSHSRRHPALASSSCCC
jgi:L-cystine uptake protein TcyP (sodium:dicarboxylate symporter family)